MDGHTTVEVSLRGTHFHGNAKTLHHLVAPHADAVQPHDFLVLPRANHFHGGNRLIVVFTIEYSVEEIGELARVDLDLLLTVFLPRLLLGEPNRPNRRVTEDDGRDVLVARLGVGKLWTCVIRVC